MKKEIYAEIVQHHMLLALNQIKREENIRLMKDSRRWDACISSMVFTNKHAPVVDIHWKNPTPGHLAFPLQSIRFYVRGDTESSVLVQKKIGVLYTEDKIRNANTQIFYNTATKILRTAGLINKFRKNGTTRKYASFSERFISEEEFHDDWADSIEVKDIDIYSVNEMITSPEMRFIHKTLGEVKSKKILDVGCGLGEVGVYFALRGADVTITDISHGMLNKAQQLASSHHVSVTACQSTIENLFIPGHPKFDIIYVGNLFHHVNIDCAITRLLQYLKPDGIMISRDPLAYNPVIKLYRAIATKVRSKDEHPFTLRDIRIFQKYFYSVKTRYFWFTTLIIFIIMAFIQGRSPNKERYWKKIEKEGNDWAWIYKPLEKIDTYLLTTFPFLQLQCWNVVVYCHHKKNIRNNPY